MPAYEIHKITNKKNMLNSKTCVHLLPDNGCKKLNKVCTRPLGKGCRAYCGRVC